MSFDDSDWFGSSPSPGSSSPKDEWGVFSTGSTGGSSIGDEWGAFSTGSPGTSTSKRKWAVLLTMVSLVLTVGASFLVSYLTRDVAMRPAWMIGLMFFAPAVALALGALMTENLSNSMTPRFSRRAQSVVALLVALIPFVVGLFGGALIRPAQTVFFEQYMLVQDRGDIDQAASSDAGDLTQSLLNQLPDHANVGLVDFGSVDDSRQAYAKQYILLLDRSISIDTTDPRRESATAIRSMLNQLADDVQVGLIIFSHEILTNIPIGALTSSMRATMDNSLNKQPQGGTDFELPLTEALKQLKNSPLSNGELTQLIMLTDGESVISNVQALADQCAKYNAVISCVKLGDGFGSTLSELVKATGGQIVAVDGADDLLDALLTVSASLEKVVLQTVPMVPLSDSARASLSTAIRQHPDTGTDTADPIAHALDQLEAADSTGRPTSLVVMTNGAAGTFQQNYQSLIERCAADNVTVSWVKVGQEKSASLTELVTKTHGIIVDSSAKGSLLEALVMEIPAVEIPDALRRQDSASDLIAAILLIVTGLVFGIGLSIMLSQQGQKRFQLILSPVMGIAAFLLCKKVLPGADIPGWCVEWASFSLYGLVFMKKNR